MSRMGGKTGRSNSSNNEQLRRILDLTRREADASAQPSDARLAAQRLSFYDWVRAGHFFADREPVDFETWRYLRPIYGALSQDPTGADFVIMKSAQGGASILALLYVTWLALRGRVQIAYFVPTQELARTMSTTRFIRLVRENAAIHQLMGDIGSPRARRGPDEGSAAIRHLGPSIIYFTHTTGRVSTESMPLDALAFDEVQEMSLADMQKAAERVAASPLGTILRISTANFPGADIHFFYELSDQREFHTSCRCSGGIVLADAWTPSGPTCIDRGSGATPGVPRTPFYVCPRCNEIITDPQDGLFVPHNEGADRIGFHFPQMLSPRVTPARILSKWDTRVSTQHFYNRVLGRPYVDPNSMPVTQAHLEAAQDHTLRWGPPDTRTTDGVFMGIDQMGGCNYVVIKARQRGRLVLVHLEVIEGNNPWKRCAELMHEYHVRTAAVENLPNFNEAHRFAQAFPGKVFIAHYQPLADDLVRWGDRMRDSVSDRRSQDEIRSEFTVAVDQYKMMSHSLAKWSNGEVKTPDARALSQWMRTPHGTLNVQICRDVFWVHLQKVALVTEPVEGREDERRYVSRVRKVGVDPHFAFANMLSDVALSRVVHTGFMLGAGPCESDDEPRKAVNPMMQQIHAAFPYMEDSPDPDFTCGTCTEYVPEEGRCGARLFRVKPEELACPFYVPELED
jgi:hypothetical protein